MADAVPNLPCRVKVRRVVESRYTERQTTSPGVVPHRTELMLGLSESRPMNWDKREPGVDVVETEDGATLKLWSDGGQSVPKPGWVLLIREGDSEKGYLWTLYGIPAGTISAAA